MPAALNPTLAWIVGRATLTIVVSSTTISWTVASSTSAPVIGAARWAFAVPPPPARAPRGALAGRSLSLVRMVQSSGCHRRPGWPAHYPIWHTLPFLSIYVIYASVSHETTSLSERPRAPHVRSPGRPPPARPRRVRQRRRRGHRRGRPAFRRGPPAGTSYRHGPPIRHNMPVMSGRARSCRMKHDPAPAERTPQNSYAP